MAKKNVPQKDEVLKIPVTLADFKYKKLTQSWDITFEVQPENLNLSKSLMDYMGEHFVLCLVPVKNMDAIKEALEKNLAEGLEG